MDNHDHDHDHEDHEDMKKAQAQMQKAFSQMPHKVPLLLFTMSGKNEAFTDAARQVIRALRQYSSKISLKEFDLNHKEARKWKVTEVPTLLLDPKKYNIRWLGAPMGEETRSFVEAMLMMGYSNTSISEEGRKVLDKIDSPRQIRLFVSPTCSYCPQQVVNALKAAIEKPDLISLEIIDIQANPKLAEQYAAQSVPQAYANEKLIAMGAQSEVLFMASLEKLEQQNIFIPESDAEEVETDLLIVGGGPAGLTAGIYAVRSGLNTVIIERDVLGGQVATTPIVENYPGFTSVGGKSLVDIMVSHALEYVQIFQSEEVIEVKIGEPIEIRTTRRRILAKAMLLATGASHRKMDVPGEDRLSGRGVSYCSTCDGPIFKGKKVVMVGGGDSAVTEALHLYHMGVDVTLIHRRESLRAQEYLVKNLNDNHIPIIWNSEIKEIQGEERVKKIVLHNNKGGEDSILDVDGVFVAIGYRPSVDLAEKIGVELTEDGYIKQDSRHRTNIPGIYSAGDVEGGYKQIVTAAGQGAEAAMTIFEDIVNPYWKKDKAA